MTNDQVNRLASEVIDASNAVIARLNMHKDGWLTIPERQIHEYHKGRIAVAQSFLDMVAAESLYTGVRS